MYFFRLLACFASPFIACPENRVHRFRKLLCTVWGLISSCPFKLFSYFVCLHGCASFVYCICTRCLVFSARCVENSKNPKVRLFGVVFFFRVWKFSVLLLFLYSLFFFSSLKNPPAISLAMPITLHPLPFVSRVYCQHHFQYQHLFFCLSAAVLVVCWLFLFLFFALLLGRPRS